MDFEKLLVDIASPQRIEINIEFLVDALGAYHGLDNLDETWYNNIMPILKKSIMDSGGYILKSNLELVKKLNQELLSYTITIICKPPCIDLNSIINNLTNANMQSSLRINRVCENGAVAVLYLDYEHMVK